MEIKDILKQRRLELSLTMADVAKAVGVSEATVCRWESGYISNMRQNRIAQLAKVLQLKPSVIMGWEDDSTETMLPANIIPMPKMRKIPLLGTIACGEPILAQENIEGDVSVPDDIKADFALRCKGDSMIDANIYDGDIVYIKQQPTVNNGEIAAVLIGEEATLKRFYQSGETITLMPCNTALKPLVYTGLQLEEISILGKATYYLSRVR